MLAEISYPYYRLPALLPKRPTLILRECMKSCLLVLCSLFFLQSCELAKFETPSASGASGEVSGNVMLYWSPPQERVNGDLMNASEIGGYEVRYRASVDDPYTVVLITDASLAQLALSDIPAVAKATFEVAVFDTDGIYSDFVVATGD